MFDLGIQELIVIFIVALLVFGPKRLPELGRTLGKGMAELKKAMHGVKEQMDAEMREIKEPLSFEPAKSYAPEPQEPGNTAEVVEEKEVEPWPRPAETEAGAAGEPPEYPRRGAEVAGHTPEERPAEQEEPRQGTA